MSSYRVVRRNSKYALVMDAKGDLWKTNRFVNVVCGGYVSLSPNDLVEVYLDKRLKTISLPKGKRVKGIYQPSAEETLQYNWWNTFSSSKGVRA